MNDTFKRSRAVVASVVAAAGLAAIAPAAQAKSYAGGVCDGQSFVQAFTAWGDNAQYVLAPGGDFEGDLSSSWALLGGAAVRDGNEPAQVGGPDDSTSLRLVGDSYAGAAPLCVTYDYPWMRLFAKNTGDPKSKLTVSVNYRDVLGFKHDKKVADIKAGSEWSLSDQIPTLAGKLGSQLSIRLSTKDDGGDWSVDDVYVDPRMRF